ncbi:gamma-glutamyltransferase [Aliikangiella coralliicola]|uniref:Glutathione hydrolase proenzyme n=1 Tax=Aliikangiella coralliicola TaxID=2592383 RepID=A0A545UD08_9GAMM|nr:gamma-glutamyltransferase [Aliikangiella coralliicola]TQV87341.1 gamma-glutamyltransferase [Aliikangiella coralliicola]
MNTRILLAIKSLFFSLVSVTLLVSSAIAGEKTQIRNNASAKNVPLLEFNSRIFPEVATNGMVVSQESRATQAGVKVLEQGGNAVDAAVAVGFALAVTLPRAGNIGGGGFMLIYDNQSKKVNALDYREKAPYQSHRDMFLDEELNVDKRKSRYSILSSGVPGTVAGLVEAHRKFGRLPFEKVVQPAIELARRLPVTLSIAQSLNARAEYLSRDPETKRIFVKGKGDSWSVGEDFKQQDLANTLSLIAKSNGDDFYRGKTAKKIVKFFKESGGLITAKDLQDYRAVWRDPISTTLGDYQIFAMPPPSSGGVHLVQLLNIVRQFPVSKSGPNTAYTTHIKTEAMKFAYADRSKYLGDPDFVKVPVKSLTDDSYAERIAKRIDLNKVLSPQEIKPGQYFDQESPQTTHFSVIDGDGNIVSNTYTLNFSFGSGITVPGTGMLLNNEMDDFSAKPGVPNAFGLLGGEANAIQPQKRPLSSMTPVIALNKGEPWLATGSPGGSRIITIVFNFLLNRLAHGMNIAEATMAPRIHHQWYPDKLQVEKGFPIDTISLLKQKGHNVEMRKPWGSLQSIELQDGVFFGFADPRRPGALAKGYFGKSN